MKIKKVNGKFFEGDQIITIQTKGEEAFTFRDLFLVVNAATINEVKRCKTKYNFNLIENGFPLFFENAIKDAINTGKKEIDLTDPKNEEVLKLFCSTNKINFSKMKQTRLEDFEI